jgi:hypothetical protein
MPIAGNFAQNEETGPTIANLHRHCTTERNSRDATFRL